MFLVFSFAICLCVPLIVFWVLGPPGKGQRPIKLAIFSFIAIYAIILISIYSYESYLDYKLMSFDLNGDEVFSGQEITPEQEKYMSLVTNDTGRTFAPITGFIFAFLYSALFYLLLKVIGKPPETNGEQQT